MECVSHNWKTGRFLSNVFEKNLSSWWKAIFGISFHLIKSIVWYNWKFRFFEDSQQSVSFQSNWISKNDKRKRSKIHSVSWKLKVVHRNSKSSSSFAALSISGKISRIVEKAVHKYDSRSTRMLFRKKFPVVIRNWKRRSSSLVVEQYHENLGQRMRL